MSSRFIKYTLCVAALLLVACRQQSDNVLNYAYNDNMAFGSAEKSYAAKFDVMWYGLNANYALWDFEYENGLDWDQVYDTYRPKFENLDKQQTAVSDLQLKSLLDSVLAPLHDGHLVVRMENHATGKYVGSSPGQMRVVRERSEEYAAVRNKTIGASAYTWYRNAGDIIEERHSQTNPLETCVEQVVLRLQEQVSEWDDKKAAGTITPEEQDSLTIYGKVLNELLQALTQTSSDQAAVSAYNILAYRYEYLQIPGLVPVDPTLVNYAMNLSYVLFKSNGGTVAYLAFDRFRLSAYLEPEYTEELFGTPSASTQAVIDDLKATWRAWFNAIQAHQQAGDLHGVIIDIRSNGGGYMNDFKFALGALLPAGGHHNTDARFKRGTGRYDYSPVMPQNMPTLEEAHVTVTAPIVTLCNCASVSMAEHTSYGTKMLDNGTLIGTRTFGGFSALVGAEGYTTNYAGHVGVQGVTPVFCYVPMEVAFSLDGHILEGHGVDPDIEVAFDVATWNKGNGPDSQLDRALQFIK